MRHVFDRALPEPPRPVVGVRGWKPASVVLGALALAALLWVEVAVWRAVSGPPPLEAEEARTMLAQVSAALFSLQGDPPVEDDALEQADEAECAGSDWLVRAECRPGGAS